MHIEVDQCTYNRISKYSSQTGIPAILVVKEALNEWMDDTGDLIISMMKKKRASKPEPATKRSKRKPAVARPLTNVMCISSSVKFSTEAAADVGMLETTAVL